MCTNGDVGYINRWINNKYNNNLALMNISGYFPRDIAIGTDRCARLTSSYLPRLRLGKYVDSVNRAHRGPYGTSRARKIYADIHSRSVIIVHVVTVFFNLVKKTKNQSKQAQAKSQKRETYSEQKRTKDVRA